MKNLLLAAAIIAIPATAFAADMPNRRAPQPVFKPASVPTFAWTGFYVGANAGAVWGDFTKGGSFINPKTGFTGGVTAGYNHQIENFVVGLEGDYNYSGLKGNGFVVPGTLVKGSMSSFGTVRGRLGVAFDRALIYGTGGYALGQTTIENGLFKSNSSSSGYVIGGGLEYALTQNISAKAEYLYMPLGGRNLTGVPGFANGAKTGLDASVVRGGVNYRF